MAIEDVKILSARIVDGLVVASVNKNICLELTFRAIIVRVAKACRHHIDNINQFIPNKIDSTNKTD